MNFICGLSMKIEDITINLHCGCSREVVNQQVEDLKKLDDYLDINWNLRIDRYPKAYPSYSQLMNHAIATSKSEWMIFVNDRCKPTVSETWKIVNLLREGFGCVMLYNVAYMGFSKELVRKIGWWDEGYKLGGYEDNEFILRLRHADIAVYESEESTYDYSWKSPLQVIGHNCRESRPYFEKKWDLKYQDAIVKNFNDPTYEHWDLFLGDARPDISSTWKDWSHSKLNLKYDKPNSGPAPSTQIKGRKIYNLSEVEHLINKK